MISPIVFISRFQIKAGKLEEYGPLQAEIAAAVGGGETAGQSEAWPLRLTDDHAAAAPDSAFAVAPHMVSRRQAVECNRLEDRTLSVATAVIRDRSRSSYRQRGAAVTMRSDDVVLTGRVANWSVAKWSRLVVAVAMSGVLGGCGPVAEASPGASVGPSAQPSPAAITSLPTDGELAIGRAALTLDGVELSFEVPSAGWTTSTYAGGRTVDKDLVEPADGLPDGASVFFWAPSPSQIYTDPCHRTLGPEVGPSAADLAAAVSKVPGTDALGPSDVILGGRQAKSVVLTIREDVGCDPGSFYLWAAGSTYRYATALGDEIHVWVVDVDGWRGMIEAETRKEASPETKADLQRLVDSIDFD